MRDDAVTVPRPTLPDVLFDDAPGPAYLALALQLGRSRLASKFHGVEKLDARRALEHPHALLLAPTAEYAALQETHLVSPALAVAGSHRGAVALTADYPFEQVEAPRVEFDQVSRTSECLARATIWRFYGIRPALFVRDGATSVPPPPPDDGPDEASEGETGVVPGEHVVRVLEGAAALRALSEGMSGAVADLGRAWFILTGLPFVSHLLLVPRALLTDHPGAYELAVDGLRSTVDTINERRKALRREVAARYQLSNDAASDFFGDLRWTFDVAVQKSTVQLFNRGAWGMGLPLVRKLQLVDEDELAR